MDRLAHVSDRLKIRKSRVRSRVAGTTKRPRLTVYVSNRHIGAQIIDDTTHTTLAAVTTVGQKVASGPLVQRAEWVGAEIAKKAKTVKIKQVVFDRNGRLFHGRVKALADKARQEGLEF